MRKFKRRGGVLSSELTSDEVQLLESLFHQLIDMIRADSGGSGSDETSGAGGTANETAETGETGPPSGEEDPFEVWAREFADDTPVEAPQDPVIARLLPDAYPNDAEASAEFRRFTDRDLRDKKIRDAEAALQQLAQTNGGAEELRIPVDQVEPWLRALTSIRIAVAGRLGITDNVSAEELAELPEDDPRAFMASVYDWLGYAQETLVTAL